MREVFSKFPLGRLVATANAFRELRTDDVLNALNRHRVGDWGEVCAEDRRANDDALAHGGRLVSVYRSAEGSKFWILTEADRSATTVLFPEDY